MLSPDVFDTGLFFSCVYLRRKTDPVMLLIETMDEKFITLSDYD